MAGGTGDLSPGFSSRPHTAHSEVRSRLPLGSFGLRVSQNHGSPSPSLSPRSRGGSERTSPKKAEQGVKPGQDPGAGSLMPLMCPRSPRPPTADPRPEGTPCLGAGAFPAQYSSEGPGVGTGPAQGFRDGCQYSYRQTSLTAGAWRSSNLSTAIGRLKRNELKYSRSVGRAGRWPPRFM